MQSEDPSSQHIHVLLEIDTSDQQSPIIIPSSAVQQEMDDARLEVSRIYK